MSALPKSIREQIEAAEKLHGEVYNPPSGGKPDGEKPEVSSEKPEKTGHPEPEKTPTQAEGLKQEPAKAAVPDKAETPPAEPAKPTAVKDDTDAWKKRYDILKGKYDAEVPRMAAQIREMKGEMDGLRGLLANLQQPPVAAAPAGKPQAPASLIDPKEREEYGDELISVIQRGAQEVFNPEVAGLKEEIAQLKKQLGGMGQTLQTTQQGTLIDRLAQEVPEWEELNNDELFIDWLKQEDRYSGGLRRQELLDRAYKNNDAARVIQFFKGYLEENAALQPPQDTLASPPPARNTETTLDDMVAPGKPSAAPGKVAQTGNKRTWTQKQISAFYRKVNAGKYRNKPKEQEEIERDIVAAAGEGRITA